MGKINVTTLVAFVATVAAVTTLAALGKPEVAALSGTLGALVTAILQPLVGKGGT